MGFFGLYGSTAALATTLTLAAAINCIGIGFQRGTHTRWQLVTNDGTGAPTLTDMGVSFGIATGGVLTLFIAVPPNGSSVWVRVVDEVSGAVFEQEVTADLPAATQFLSPRLFLNTGATAAAVAYDCAGVYLETDFYPRRPRGPDGSEFRPVNCLGVRGVLHGDGVFGHGWTMGRGADRPDRRARRPHVVEPDLCDGIDAFGCSALGAGPLRRMGDHWAGHGNGTL